LERCRERRCGEHDQQHGAQLRKHGASSGSGVRHFD
jgi:hypothetical protein